jgi:predicted DNA-binding transcriptional regulator YafY
MLSTSARLLRLAALLQSRRHWSGTELAESLEVDARTVRRDVERLRELGYPIDASAGIGGGYALGRGADLPPLVLDDEEAVALAISLRVATASIGGLEDTAVRLLAKLDHLLPARLKRRVSALHAMTLSLRIGEPLIDAALLSTLATSCRDCLALTFSYRDHHGESSRRQVQPLRLASYGRRWYLVGWDVSRADWRTFRVDRIKPKPTIGAAFSARSPPADVAAKIERGIAYAPFAFRITLRLDGPVSAHAGTIPTWCGLLESDGDQHSLLRVGADSIEALLAQVVMIGRDAEFVEGEEWLPALQALMQTAATTLSKVPRPKSPALRLRDAAPPRRRATPD